MATVEMSEAEMVGVAMDLGERLGEKSLPLNEMEIIAFYHPEEETRRLAGKAIVVRAVKSGEPEEKTAARLSDISTNERYHIEAREEAGKELCGIIRKMGAWEKSYQIAMDKRYPPATREIAASDFLGNPGDAHCIAAVLGCLGISERMREEKGFGIVKDALENGNRALVEIIGAEKGLPPMLTICIKSITGKGSCAQRFARESIPPSPMGIFEGLGPLKRK